MTFCHRECIGKNTVKNVPLHDSFPTNPVPVVTPECWFPGSFISSHNQLQNLLHSPKSELLLKHWVIQGHTRCSLQHRTVSNIAWQANNYWNNLYSCPKFLHIFILKCLASLRQDVLAEQLYNSSAKARRLAKVRALIWSLLEKEPSL